MLAFPGWAAFLGLAQDAEKHLEDFGAVILCCLQHLRSGFGKEKKNPVVKL